MITAGNTTNRNGNMASKLFQIILLVTVVCWTSPTYAGDILQDYAICKPCTVLPSIITQLFEIFTKRSKARSLVHCAAKCQRTSACLASIYCFVREVGQCTLVLKKRPILDVSRHHSRRYNRYNWVNASIYATKDLGLPLLGVSLGVSADSATDDGPVLFPSLGSQLQLCKCVLFPAVLGLSRDSLKLLNIDLGLQL